MKSLLLGMALVAASGASAIEAPSIYPSVGIKCISAEEAQNFKDYVVKLSEFFGFPAENFVSIGGISAFNMYRGKTACQYYTMKVKFT